MISLSLLFELPGMSVDQLEVETETITIKTHVEACEAACPICHTLAQRVHSHYTRTLHDVPCGTKALRLVVQVRRFFCDQETCPRQIFAERLPALTQVKARATTRFVRGLAEVGFALGGRAGAQLGAVLGWRQSRSSILRTLRRLPEPKRATPRLLGVDDWAFRRRAIYGTMLLDLEMHTPVDLLPDRTAQTLAAWLKAHPGVQLISRDRAGEYAQGAKKGAPKAVQAADRFHLTKNLSEVVERILSHHRQALREIRFKPRSPRSSSPLAVRYLRPDRKLRKQEVLQAKLARAEQIRGLLAQGMTQLAVARQLHLNRKTVALYAKVQSIMPVLQPARAGILAPFTRYLSTRWQAGERNGVGLYREIVAQGYTGSRMTVERFLLGLRDLERQGQLPAVLSAPIELTPHRAVGLLLKRAEERTEEETQALLRVGQIHPDLLRTQLLMQQFLQMLRERHGHELDQWLAAAFHSGIPEWRAFVRKLRQDHDAVQTGLILKWNNGPVEGHINRLKFVKRSMYGRANFDLLRFRVLHHRK
jgi:transposase